MTITVSRRRFLGGTAAVAASVALPATSAGAMPIAADAASGAASPKTMSSTLLTDWMHEIYEQVRVARCSPPSAARIYAHVALAAWEAIVPGVAGGRSLGGQLNGFRSLDATSASRAIQFDLALNRAVADASVAAFADRSAEIVAGLTERGDENERALRSGVPRPLVERSISHGRAVGQAVAERLRTDGYAEILGRTFTPPVGPDKWVPTPPNFGTSIEPYWAETTSFTLTSNDVCKPAAPVAFSTQPGSAFHAQAMATHDAVINLTDHQRETALYWRDNPDGSAGLPAGHWMLIACDVIDDEGMSLAAAAEVLVVLGLSLADGFTSCWTEKYQSNLLRPVTYIQRYIDPTWQSFVNSPAFPEYTSGHSVGSAAAAGALTALLGPMPFTDTSSALSKGLTPRQYSSFWEAAEEAADSRLAGGIHYPMGIDVGISQGRDVAGKVVTAAQTRRRG